MFVCSFRHLATRSETAGANQVKMDPANEDKNEDDARLNVPFQPYNGLQKDLMWQYAFGRSKRICSSGLVYDNLWTFEQEGNHEFRISFKCRFFHRTAPFLMSCNLTGRLDC